MDPFLGRAPGPSGEHCWLTQSRDITERKRIEEERERLLLQEKGRARKLKPRAG
jgi:hypothetical protein